MTNGELFKIVFGKYATEVWAYDSETFVNWHEEEAPEVEAIPLEDFEKMKKLVDRNWYRYVSSGWQFNELIDEVIKLWRSLNE